MLGLERQPNQRNDQGEAIENRLAFLEDFDLPDLACDECHEDSGHKISDKQHIDDRMGAHRIAASSPG